MLLMWARTVGADTMRRLAVKRFTLRHEFRQASGQLRLPRRHELELTTTFGEEAVH